MTQLFSNPDEVFNQIYGGNDTCLYQLDSTLTENKKFLINLFSTVRHQEHFYLASRSLQNDRDFLDKILSNTPNMFEYFPNSYQNDIELATKAVMGNFENFAHVSKNLRNKPNFVTGLLLARFGLIDTIEIVSKAAPPIDDEQEAMQAVALNPNHYNKCSVELKNNLNIIHTFLNNIPKRSHQHPGIPGISNLFDRVSIRVNCILMHRHTQRRLSLPVEPQSLLEMVNLLVSEDLTKEFRHAKNHAQNNPNKAEKPKKSFRV